ncbi:MarR family winged helix-turn-helix transcriptional regulator [Actinokineospora diospyrosa]|uniref:DNA-binding transcriptional regulator, MarR family n=1 Tax=Actinokineospora diospyrosa TaxID=103728 RepID=A0ABT1ILZ7_9PSEU|nr:MarR family transcriptional regulator [Actinokineospora diospyrosa]MCP2273543.1 DNA-binding transcriptional regulator, MarR family [Actinokineospora diospyrosa]
MAGQRDTQVPDLVDLLTRAQRALARDLGTALEEETTTVDQWRVLRALAAADGRSMGELAITVEIPHPTLTRLVDALVDSALTYRTQSTEDRRRVSVHISELGRAKLDRLEALAAAHERTLVERLSAETVTALSTLLRDLQL